MRWAKQNINSASTRYIYEGVPKYDVGANTIFITSLYFYVLFKKYNKIAILKVNKHTFWECNLLLLMIPEVAQLSHFFVNTQSKLIIKDHHNPLD